MIRYLTKNLLKLSAISALCLTVASTPVSAETHSNDDGASLAAILTLLFGAAAIGAIVSKDGELIVETDRPKTYPPKPPHPHGHFGFHGHHGHIDTHRPHRHGHHTQPHAHAPIAKPHVHKPVAKPAPKPRITRLPTKCLRAFKTQFGQQRYWGTQCLRNNKIHVSSLPSSCAQTIVAKNRNHKYVTRKVYEPTCLRTNGFFPRP